MSDNANQPGGPKEDLEHIDVNREQEVRNWARKFDASPGQIKEAVQAVGNRADKVELHLKGSRSSSNSERASHRARTASSSSDKSS